MNLISDLCLTMALTLTLSQRMGEGTAIGRHGFRDAPALHGARHK
jgi:hypothetical protein